jgi:hypothetical protein
MEDIEDASDLGQSPPGAPLNSALGAGQAEYTHAGTPDAAAPANRVASSPSPPQGRRVTGQQQQQRHQNQQQQHQQRCQQQQPNHPQQPPASELHVFGEIVDASGFRGRTLACSWQLAFDPLGHWKLLKGDARVRGCIITFDWSSTTATDHRLTSI